MTRVLTIAVAAALLGACGPREVSLACTPYASPEELAERASPFDSVQTSTGGATAKLCYSRPYAKGRVVFGELVPWDQLWRTGANEATTLILSAPAEIAGLSVGAGRYSLYSVPSEGDWMLVVNASTSQWGQTRDVELPGGNVSRNAYTAEIAAEEVGRVVISSDRIDYVEQFTASFEVATGGSVLFLDWENTRITVPIDFELVP